MFKKRKPQVQEKRRYIRLKSVFPVDFRIINPRTQEGLSGWKQGFTSDISKGGLCLTINNPEEDVERYLIEKSIFLGLSIHIPLGKRPIGALSRIAWVRRSQEKHRNQYFIGLEYIDIEKNALARILRHARWMRFTTQVSIYLILGLALIVGSVSFYTYRLKMENQRLISEYVDILKEDSKLREGLREIQLDKEGSEKMLGDYKNNIAALKVKLSEAEDRLESELKDKKTQETIIQESQAAISQLQKTILDLSNQQKELEEEISKLITNEDSITRQLGQMEKTKLTLEEATVKKMYMWLKTHQNSRTGLVLSFEGDAGLDQWAFTYDQALASQVYALFADFESAKSIFNFYNNAIKKTSGFNGFVNAYYADSKDVAEYIIHCGPNIWLGIAILQYSKLSGDSEYLPLAIRIADWLISIQDQDPEGGIRGGPYVRWFATEHNLDAFAFFTMLYKATNNQRYDLSSRKILSWLKKHAYDKPDPPVKRGKGDASIATDTYAWSIAALGPERLKSLDMNPDDILEFAVDNCEVEVYYNRPQGDNIKVKGFDFAKYRNMPRGGIMSSEWTAQMVLAFKIMSEFYADQGNQMKAKEYDNRANIYLNELGKLIMSSASPTGQGEGCLPYATAQNADTGHGWRTPVGKKTGSIAGTVYTIFAYRDFNPLEIK